MTVVDLEFGEETTTLTRYTLHEYTPLILCLLSTSISS